MHTPSAVFLVFVNLKFFVLFYYVIKYTRAATHTVHGCILL